MDPRLKKQDPRTPRYAQQHTQHQYALHLEYHNTKLPQAQDAITNAVAVDLYCELGLDTQQPDCATLVFDSEPEQTMAALFLSRYTQFTVRTD